MADNLGIGVFTKKIITVYDLQYNYLDDPDGKFKIKNSFTR